MRHGQHGLFTPGLSLSPYETCGRVFCDIMHMCVPDDAMEDADNIRETHACHENGFDFLWYILKVVVGMMDRHMVPKPPEYSGSLSRDAGC